MKLADAVILWTPEWVFDTAEPDRWKAGVVVLPRGRHTEAWRQYRMKAGAVTAEWRAATDAERMTLFLTAFVDLAVRDRLAPEVIHTAFLAVDEYRWQIAEDTPGAEYPPE